MSRLRQRFHSALWKVRVEDEVAQELEFHVDMRARELIAKGMSPERARAWALARFKGLGEVERECRRIARLRDRRLRALEWLEELRQDLHFALRQMRRAPLMTALLVLMLGLGIGANTAMFSVVNAVLLKPLPYPEPDRLVRLYERTPQGDRFSVSAPNFLDFRRDNQTLAGLAAVSFPVRQFSSIGDGRPAQFRGTECTASLFDVLGVRPLLGRTFRPDEDRPRTPARVMMISERLWRSRFGSDPGIVGRVLDLNDVSWTVVGVVQVELGLFDGLDAWVPLGPDPEFPRGDHRLEVVGRLAPGVSLGEARADLARVAAQLGRAYPDSNRGWGVELLSFPEWLVSPHVRRMTLVPLFAVGLMLVLACVNLSNLLLARASVRSREVGMRAALGASRARIIRQLLTESFAVAILGAAAGLALAYWALPVMQRLYPDALPRFDQAALDGRTLLFTVVVSIAVGVASGLAPAWQTTRGDLFGVLRQGFSASGAEGHRLREGLVIAEVALAMMLLVGAGLLARSFGRLSTVDTGFDARQVVAAPLTLPEESYAQLAPETARFYRQVLERLEAIPGVESAAASMVNPLRGPRPANQVGPLQARDRSEFLPIQWRSVTPSYFRAMRIPLLRGRTFADTDRLASSDSPREGVAVISVGLARRLWGKEQAVGQRLQWNRPGGSILRVIGVVGEVNDTAIGPEAPLMLYLSHEQLPWPQMTLLVRSYRDPGLLTPAIRRAVAEVDPLVPVPSVFPLERSVAEVLAGPRLNFQLSGAFALLALVMASLGLYGVMSYSVSRRSHEMGVRMTLGARPGSLVALILRQGLHLIAAGMAVGMAAAVALTRFLGSLLYETAPTDVATFLVTAAVLSAVGLLACCHPALRAARVDPVYTLRAE
jgi:predicted permease